MATLTATFTNMLFTRPDRSSDTDVVKIAILQLNDPKAEAIQTEECTSAGVAVQRYGVWMIPMTAFNETVKISARKDDKTYSTDLGMLDGVELVGNTITFNEEV